MFTAGWNMPGYLPEMDPEEFKDFDDAQAFIVEEMEGQQDNEEDDDIYESWRAAIYRAAKRNDEFAEVAPDGYVYWVTDDQTGSRRGL